MQTRLNKQKYLNALHLMPIIVVKQRLLSDAQSAYRLQYCCVCLFCSDDTQDTKSMTQSVDVGVLLLKITFGIFNVKH